MSGRGGNKGEERGTGPLDEAACGGRVTKRRKEREGEMRGGSGTGNDGAG